MISQPVDFPLDIESKLVIYEMIEALKKSNCCDLIDSISAPMIGHNLRIICLLMKQRTSHLRNINDDNNPISEKTVTFINPVFEPEPHSNSSFQYEFNVLDGKETSEAFLVQRYDFINVKFQSLYCPASNLLTNNT
jgi:peptide deformylase